MLSRRGDLSTVELKGTYGEIDARLYWSDDRGKQWHPVNGIPGGLNKNINTFQVIVAKEGRAWAVVDDTSLFQTDDYGVNWESLGSNYPQVYGGLVA